MAQCPEKLHCTRHLVQLTSLRFTVADNAIIGVEGTHNSPDMSHKHNWHIVQCVVTSTYYCMLNISASNNWIALYLWRYACLRGSWKCYHANLHISERDRANPVKSDVTAMENSCTVHPAQVSHHVCDGASISRLQQFIVLTPCALFPCTTQKVSA